MGILCHTDRMCQTRNAFRSFSGQYVKMFFGSSEHSHTQHTHTQHSNTTGTTSGNSKPLLYSRIGELPLMIDGMSDFRDYYSGMGHFSLNQMFIAEPCQANNYCVRSVYVCVERGSWENMTHFLLTRIALMSL